MYLDDSKLAIAPKYSPVYIQKKNTKKKTRNGSYFELSYYRYRTYSYTFIIHNRDTYIHTFTYITIPQFLWQICRVYSYYLLYSQNAYPFLNLNEKQ